MSRVATQTSGRFARRPPLRDSAAGVGLQCLARLGYAARGIVFVILAYFTAIAAIDTSQTPLDSVGALGAFLPSVTGSLLLLAVALGLACFALWRETQAILDVDGFGTRQVGLAKRAGYAVAGLFYAVLAAMDFSIFFGIRFGNGDRTVHDWTARLLSQPFGSVILGATGIAIILTGLGMAVVGFRAEFRKRLGLKRKPRAFVTALGIAGYLARGAIISVIGLFLLFAALDARASEAKGLAGALAAIKHLPYGELLLGLSSLGFFAFGIYGIAEAMFRRVAGICLLPEHSR